jgi:hypothetical protein
LKKGIKLLISAILLPDNKEFIQVTSPHSSRILLSVFSFLILLICATPGLGQNETGWQAVAPAGEWFSIRMPARAFQTTRIIPLGEKEWIPSREYYTVRDRKRYMVLSFSKSQLDRTPDLSNFDTFIANLQRSFTQSAGSAMTYERDVTLNNLYARQYRLRMGDVTGIARAYDAGNNFYMVMVIGADESDNQVEQFISSFAIGQKNPEQDTGGASNTPSQASTGGPSDELPPDPWPKVMAPISAGVLNGKAVSLPKPIQ